MFEPPRRAVTGFAPPRRSARIVPCGSPLKTGFARLIERVFGYSRDMLNALKNDRMMSRLINDLNAGVDIGHYGRLVFTMIARHFGSEDDIVTILSRDADFSEAQARVMVREVNEAGYSPPKRNKILDFQARQKYAIIEDVDDPDLGNVYRDLRFPDAVYEHIEHYREEKMPAAS